VERALDRRERERCAAFLITPTISLEWELVKTSIIPVAIYGETRGLINRAGTMRERCVRDYEADA